MLSFLREPNLGELPAEAATRNVQENGTGQKQEQEYFTVASHRKAVRKTTTLLAVLFIIGLICLWFMIKKSAPQGASAAENSTKEMQIETAIARLTGIKSEMFTSMDEIISKFYEFSDVVQIQVSELLKNPFQLQMFQADTKPSEKPGLVDPEMVWKQQVRQKAKDLHLDSIMQSDKGKCCMINNKILYVGDSMGVFKVSQIEDSLVKLEAEGIEVVLTMPE
jgi:preprotein translocase subunit SecG